MASRSGNIAAYVDVSAIHEAGWRDLQSSDLQNFYGDIGWRGAHAEMHFNATMANSTLNGPGTVPVQMLRGGPRLTIHRPEQHRR